MTDGTISTVVSLAVGMLAADMAIVALAKRGARERRRADDAASTVRAAGLRAELELLELEVRKLRAQVGRLEARGANGVSERETAAARRDPPTSAAAGSLTAVRRPEPHEELARRLRDAGDARVIPFPFLADDDR